MLHSIGPPRLGIGALYGGSSRYFLHAQRRSISLGRKKISFPDLDKKWQRIWRGDERMKQKLKKLQVDEKKKKMYILPMFPYPSGDLHLGHLRVYTISDVLARFRRMQGYNVTHPIGWDAFGLPAENAAIERGIDPATWTASNIARMKSQLECMNGSWDWDREFATSDPSFYKHTQRLFLLLHERGLAYQAESLVNYDPVDKTVLANEQVDANGCSWRSGAKVEKKMLKQWFFKISEFREDLLKDLDFLAKDGAWPDRIVSQQRNWLGKSTGARIKFKVNVGDSLPCSDIEVFTTRPDTLCGVQYVALASNHPLVQKLATNNTALQAFLSCISDLPEDSKAGFLLPGVQALNPLSSQGNTSEIENPLPVYAAPYVLGDYGDGAVMGVPGHDSRDHAFWKHNCGEEPIRKVITPTKIDSKRPPSPSHPYLSEGKLTTDCGPYSGQTSAEAARNILKFLESKGLGSYAESWRLRDWLISRQRYWGTPIPIIHCDTCGPVSVPEDQLPVELPSVGEHWKGGKTGNPLESADEWINTSCPKCHGAAKRDTDTMDTFVDSSWYFMRFLDPKNSDNLFSPDHANAMLPVDVYIGGVEHAILHLLYARFISKFIATTGLWESTSHGEPFSRVLAQGMVHGRTYTDPSTGRFLMPDEVDVSVPSNPILIKTGEVANVSFEKMSKSKYNGVDPGSCIAIWGADATRAHMLFQAPVDQVLEWDEDKILGITRWMKRIEEHLSVARVSLWCIMKQSFEMMDVTPKGYFVHHQDNMKQAVFPDYITLAHKKKIIEEWENNHEQRTKLWRTAQVTIRSVTQAYSETYALNTVVSDLMTLTNALIEHDKKVSPYDFSGTFVSWHAWRALTQMMAPIMPAFAEECWTRIEADSIIIRFPNPRDVMYNLASRILTLNSRKNYFPIRFGSFTMVRKPLTSHIFHCGFPEVDGTEEMLVSGRQMCAVQINGKTRCVVEIRAPEAKMKGGELERWVVEQILGTDEERTLIKKGTDVRLARKVIVVKMGKTVNFVM